MVAAHDGARPGEEAKMVRWSAVAYFCANFALGAPARAAADPAAGAPSEAALAWLRAELGTDVCVRPAPGAGAGAYTVAAGRDRYLFRQLQTGQTPEVTRALEGVANHLEAARIGFGPSVVAHDAGQGTLLLTCVAGEREGERAGDGERFRLPVLKLLRELHAATVDPVPHVHDDVAEHDGCNALLLRAAASADAANASPLALTRAGALCHATAARLGAQARPRARLHNDLRPCNVLLADGAAHLVGWDALGWGDPLADLAHYALEHDVAPAQLPALLVDYQGDEVGLPQLQLQLARLRARRYLTWLARGPAEAPGRGEASWREEEAAICDALTGLSAPEGRVDEAFDDAGSSPDVDPAAGGLGVSLPDLP